MNIPFLRCAAVMLCMPALSGCGFVKEAIPASLNPFSTPAPAYESVRNTPSAYGSPAREIPYEPSPESGHAVLSPGATPQPYNFDVQPDYVPLPPSPRNPYAAEIKENDSAYWRTHRFKAGDGLMQILSPAEWNAREITRREDTGYLSATFAPFGTDKDAPERKINVRFRDNPQSLLKKAESLQRAIKLFCGEEHVRMLVPNSDENSMLLLRLCGNMSGGMTETAGLSEYGEISLVYLLRRDEGMYTVSHDWRVPAFDADNDDAVFEHIPERILQSHASALKRTRICPDPLNCQ